MIITSQGNRFCATLEQLVQVWLAAKVSSAGVVTAVITDAFSGRALVTHNIYHKPLNKQCKAFSFFFFLACYILLW